jgi:aspartyl protease family protein
MKVGAALTISSVIAALLVLSRHQQQQQPSPPKAAYDYGGASEQVDTLTEQLTKEPCDRPKTLELSRTLLEAGDNRGAIARTETFVKRCGHDPGVRRVAMTAHEHLSEWKFAAADATELIESDPYNADYRAWRGLQYEELRDWERAAEDYRQALAFRPRLRDVPLNLAMAYDHLGRPCDALFPLEQLVFYYPGVPMPGVESRITELSVQGNCTRAGKNVARIPYTAAATAIRARVAINGRDAGVFIIDTGASYVTLSAAAAVKLALDLSRASKLMLTSATGRAVGALTVLESVDIDGLIAFRVPVVVVEELPDVGGLIGLSYLSRFDIKQTKGVLELAARRSR